ncbi:MAG: hypothetical protein VKP62_14070 [Candidatus Sericytochromatia bacterium]|nr:hypothetical protein [Candidatus Sericytochromatia bacterium]
MTDRPSPDSNARDHAPSAPSPALGGDRRSGGLDNIAPSVVAAFFKERPVVPTPPPLAELPPAVEAPTPRKPDSLGDLKSLDGEALRARQLKIAHLAQMFAGREALAREAAPPAAAPEASPLSPPLSPPREGTKRLASPAKPANPRAATGPLGRVSTGGLKPKPDVRARHLELRRNAAGAGAGAPPATGEKLDRLVANALGQEGVVALRQAIAVIEDAALPARLQALTARVTDMVPGADGVVRLGADVGKRVLVSNLDPITALSLAAKESAANLERLKQWSDLSHKERMLATTSLTANLAELVGAVTPPPVNFGAQLASAGLQLVNLAVEHTDSLETVTAGAVQGEATRRVLGEVGDRSAVLAHRVKEAWGDLATRLDTLKTTRPRAPVALQRVFDSQSYDQFRQHPATKGLATGLENLVYNLTRRAQNGRDQLQHWIARQRRKPR